MNKMFSFLRLSSSTTFKDLPPEIRRKIVEEIEDYETASQVSKEWRYNVKTSKKIMQRELDKFFFFYIIWYTDIDEQEEVAPFPWFWDIRTIKFVFPIVTLKQFTVLKRLGKTKNSQVAAVEKNPSLMENLRENDGNHHCSYFYSNKLTRKEKREEPSREIKLGSTEDLVARIRNFKVDKASETKYLGKGGLASKAIYSYLKGTIDSFNMDFDVRGGWVEPDLSQSVKFSSSDEMRKLLRGEHKILCDGPQTFFIKPHNYGILKEIMNSMKMILDEDDTTYNSLSKSLIIPRWGTELKTLEDYDEVRFA